MKITYVEGNLMDVVGEKFVAHAISRDYTLGAGLAKQLNEKYNLSLALFRDYDSAYVGDAVQTGNIFNLIVKDTYKEKVVEEDVFMTLCDLKEKILDLSIKEICMPRICCGHEKMDWQDIEDFLYDVFGATDVNIVVYDLSKKKESKPLSNGRKAELFDSLVDFAVSMIPDEDDVPKVLSSIGFKEDEIAYITDVTKTHSCGKECGCNDDCDCSGNCGDDCKCKADKLNENYTFETGM